MSGRKISIRSLKTLEVTVLMGGVSSERKISLVSGEAVYKSLLSQGYKARKFDLQYSNMNHFFSLKTDFVFIALHGMLGEDGFVQSVLEMKGIPYSGSGPLASALSLNKYYAKAVMMQNQIPTPAFKMVSKKGFAKSIISKVKSFPVVVKPVSQGSAIGIDIASNRRELEKCVRKAFKYDSSVLVEKYISGTEISVPVLGGRTLPLIEIVPKNKFYDYSAKYEPSMSEHIIPARVSGRAASKAGDYALRLFETLGCAVFSRIDMLVDSKDNVFVLENNTIPGMTATSLFPDSAKNAGMSFDELVSEIIKLSLERG